MNFQVAIDAVTDSENLSCFGGRGMRAVRDSAVIHDLMREGLDAAEARQVAREAVLEVGGRIEPWVRRGGLRAGARPRVFHGETWWVPVSAVPVSSAEAG